MTFTDETLNVVGQEGMPLEETPETTPAAPVEGTPEAQETPEATPTDMPSEETSEDASPEAPAGQVEGEEAPSDDSEETTDDAPTQE